MLNFFNQGGQIMWILLVILIVIAYLATKNTIKLFFKTQSPDPELDIGLNAVLFWGCIAAGLGIFGHFEGIYIAMQEIIKANDTSPAIVAQGYLMSLTGIIFGLCILAMAATVWFILRWKYNNLTTPKM